MSSLRRDIIAGSGFGMRSVMDSRLQRERERR